MSKRWLSERKREPYHLKALEEGYRSRAAFKLIQLNERFGFFQSAHKVLDLGAAPGGWLQVAGQIIGDEGMILGVDLQEIEDLEVPSVESIVGDVTKNKTIQEIRRFFHGKVDVILSDMAPNVSGDWDLDHFRQIYLSRIALVISDKLLKSDGWLILKTFQGSEHEQFIREVREMFYKVKIVKPKASRKKSSEVYVVANLLKSSRQLPKDFQDEKE